MKGTKMEATFQMKRRQIVLSCTLYDYYFRYTLGVQLYTANATRRQRLNNWISL